MADAKITLTAEDRTKAAIDSARRNFTGLGQDISNSAGLITSRMGTLGVAIAAVFTGASIKGAIDVLDHLDDLAEKSGIAANDLSALRYAGEVAGTPIDALATGIKKLSVNMADAAGGGKEQIAVFKALNMEFKDGAGLKSADAALLELADKFKGMQDGPEKAALAIQLFGKSGQDMLPFLNKGADGISKLRGEAEKLGGVYDAGLAAKAGDFNDNLKRLELAAEAGKVALLQTFLPALVEVSEQLIEGRKQFGSFTAAFWQLGVKQSPFTTEAQNIHTATAAIESLKAEIADLQGKGVTADTQRGELGYLGAWLLGRDPKALQQEVDTLQKKLDYFQNLQMKRLAAPAKAAEDAFWFGQKPRAPTPVKPIDTTSAQTYVASLSKELAGLMGNVNKTDEVQEHLRINADKFTDALRKQALAYAELIDKRRWKKQVDDQELKTLQEMSTAMEQADGEYNTLLHAIMDYRKEQEFDLTLSGKNEEQIVRMRFERELQTKAIEAENQVRASLSDGLISEAEARVRLNSIISQTKQSLDSFNATQADLAQQRNDPMRGMADGLREYAYEAGQAGVAMKKLMLDAFRGMEDALVQFVRTGKLDFKSLADSIISDLIRIQIRKNMTGPLAGALSEGGSSGIFGSIAKLFSANGNAFTSSGVVHAFAQGGAFTNSIVNKPTLFPFANGTGLMGEAGPEAIMPLQRTSSGKLGVIAQGGAASSPVQVNVYNTVSQETQATVTQRSGPSGTTIDIQLDRIDAGLAARARSGRSPFASTMASLHGLNRAAGAV